MDTGSAEFHVTIVTSATPGFQMQDEISMVKAALLYADKLTLCSSNVTALFGILDGVSQSYNEFVELVPDWVLRGVDNKRPSPRLVRLFGHYKSLKAKQTVLSCEEQEFLGLMGNFLDSLWHYAQRVEGFSLAERMGFVELLPAYSAGVLDFKTLSNIDNPQMAAREFVDYVYDLVVSGVSYPLFDGEVAELVRFATDSQALRLSEFSVSHSKHVALPADVLRRLPLPDTSVEDILLVRDEIVPYLSYFRSAMIEYAGLVKSAPWDKDFQVEAQRVFHEKVSPSILSIEEAVENNSYIKGLFRRFAGNKAFLASSITALGMGLSNVHDLGDVIGVLPALSTIMAASEAVRLVVDEKLAQAGRQRVIEQNRLYLYYHAERRLR